MNCLHWLRPDNLPVMSPHRDIRAVFSVETTEFFPAVSSTRWESVHLARMLMN